MQFPVSTDPTDPLEAYDAEAARFARRGKKFLDLALKFGEIRAKGRHRDEWRAYCYGRKLELGETPVEALFDEAMEKCRAQKG